mgnify:FL=1
MKLTDNELQAIFDALPKSGSIQEVMEIIAFVAHSFQVPAVIGEHEDCIHIVLHNSDQEPTIH